MDRLESKEYWNTEQETEYSNILKNFPDHCQEETNMPKLRKLFSRAKKVINHWTRGMLVDFYSISLK